MNSSSAVAGSDVSGGDCGARGVGGCVGCPAQAAVLRAATKPSQQYRARVTERAI
jgi:hypothetical protein